MKKTPRFDALVRTVADARGEEAAKLFAADPENDPDECLVMLTLASRELDAAEANGRLTEIDRAL